MSEAGKPQVCIVMGSTSDLPTMEAAIDMLKEFEIPYTVRVLSAHRTPNETLKLAEEAKDNGIRVFIAGAGGAAHLGRTRIAREHEQHRARHEDARLVAQGDRDQSRVPHQVRSQGIKGRAKPLAMRVHTMR